MKNFINLSEKQQENKLPTNLIPVNSTEMFRIPILDRMYEIDSEL